MNIGIIVGAIVFCLYIYFMIRPIIQLRKDQQLIKSYISPDDPTTDDLRIGSKSSSFLLYNLGNDYDHIQFQFRENETFVFLKNSLSGIDQGAYLIKEKESKDAFSYLVKFYTTHFSVSGNDVKIGFKNTGILGMKYTFQLQNVNEKDIKRLKENLSKYIMT